MARIVKLMLFLLLAVALYGIASDGFTKKVEQSKYTIVSSVERQDRVSASELPYLSVAELVSNSPIHQMHSTRIQRAQEGEYLLSLKCVLQSWANRANSLSLHLGRIYNTTTSYFCQPASEYYVFALRRIII